MKINWPFTDHMVLQRNSEVTMTGQSKGSTIVRFCGVDYQAVQEGQKWHITFHTGEAGGPYTLTAADETGQIVFDDLWIGDVFLAGGQSNMEFKMKETKGRPAVEYSALNKVRYLNVPQYAEKEEDGSWFPALEEKGWQRIDENTIEELSAVAFWTVYHLPHDIPYGIISCNKGGTSASSWIDEEHLKKDDALYQHYSIEYWQEVHGTHEQQKENTLIYNELLDAYRKYFDLYQKLHTEMSAAEIKNKIGHTPWPTPPAYCDFRRPCCLYESMLKRVSCLPVKAVLYYQGEDDALFPDHYQSLLHLLIENWRSLYHQDSLPFFIVQLPDYQTGFPPIREAQRRICAEEKNCWLTVTIGTGEADNIHPQHKHVVGKRLADTVSSVLYHMECPVTPRIMEFKKVRYSWVITYDSLLEPGTVHVVGCSQGNHTNIEGQILENQILLPDCSEYEYITYAYQDLPQLEVCSLNGGYASPFLLKI